MTREEAITYLKVIWNRYTAEYEIEAETMEAMDMAIHELEIQEQRAKCRKCEHYRYGDNIFPYCVLNRDDRKPFICEFEERKGL